MKRYAALALALLLVFALAGCTLGSASSSAPVSSGLSNSVPTPSSSSSIEETEGRASVLTGLKVPLDYAGGRRIAAVSVDNHPDARPQHGLSQADILFESLTEGGITRFLALYEDYENMPVVGPVRSTRDAFLQVALPYQPLFVSLGGSQAFGEYVSHYGYEDLLLDPYYGGPDATERDMDRAAEGVDTLYANFTSGALLTAQVQLEGIDDAREYGSTYFHYVPFNEAPRAMAGDDAEDVHISHSASYQTAFSYDAAGGQYLMNQINRDGAMAPVVDDETGGQLGFDNLVILFAHMPEYEGMNHTGFEDVRNVQFGQGGAGFYVNGGKVERLFWKKDSPLHGFTLMSADRTEQDFVLNPGRCYVALVDVDEAQYFAYGPAGAAQVLGNA